MNTNNLFIPLVSCSFLTIFCWIEFLYRPKHKALLFLVIFTISITYPLTHQNLITPLICILLLTCILYAHTHKITRLPLNHPAWVKSDSRIHLKGHMDNFVISKQL